MPALRRHQAVRRILLAVAVAAGAGLAADVAPAGALAYPGSTAWTRPIGNVYLSSPTIADVNGDGIKDVVQADNAGILHVFHGGTGNELAGWPQPIQIQAGLTTPNDSTPAVADLDGDGSPEIAVGAVSLYNPGTPPKAGGLVVFNANGTVRFRKGTGDKGNVYTGGPPDGLGDGVIASPSIGDLDGDGKKEVVVGSFDNKIYAYDRFGGTVPGWPFDTFDTVWSSPALHDLDGDGAYEVFSGADANGRYGCTGGLFFALTGTGRELWHRCIGQILQSSPGITDLDGDGRFEAVFATGKYARDLANPDTKRIFALHVDDGSTVPGWPVTTNGPALTGSVAIGDLDGDGRPDVAIGTCAGCFGDAASGGQTGAVFAFRSTGQLLWQKSTAPYENFSSPIIVDVDGDGDNDVVEGHTGGLFLRDGRTGTPIWDPLLTSQIIRNAPAAADFGGGLGWRLVASSAQPNGSARVDAIRMATPATPAPWPMFRQGPDHLAGPSAIPPGPATQGYWLVAKDGGIFPFGTAVGYGSTGGIRLNQPMVGMAGRPQLDGYWLVAADGGIFPFGNAPGLGSTGGIRLNQPMVGMAATPSGRGYWLVAADGGIFPFGDAPGLGSTGGIRLNQPMVGMAATPSGRGYWLVAADGGIFPFGDAPGLGSTGSIRLNKPMVGMAGTTTGQGYWLVAADGGIFPFGVAPGYGSTGGRPLAAPVVGMVRTPNGDGYWIIGANG
ncbi:MAG: FG-GAP-like repeat-containing protein, partial [Acidimicrobiales bacterium]